MVSVLAGHMDLMEDLSATAATPSPTEEDEETPSRSAGVSRGFHDDGGYTTRMRQCLMQGIIHQRLLICRDTPLRIFSLAMRHPTGHHNMGRDIRA